ncbi:MAG: SGNH/GDSL hydrolase family protein [Bdellovibrionales bacterium]|nr:SGNH/GDSL hydrolase family protein [Bdellovibrionales bacterium]
MPSTSVKQKIALLGGGLFAGLLLSALLYFPLKSLVQWTRSSSAEGSTFESLDDLRSTMLQSDERDVKSDHSVSLRSLISPHPSDAIIYDLRPNTEVKFQGVPVRINSCGMRSREIPIAKGEDVFRIAMLGDSYVFGWGVEEDKSFVSMLEQRLNQFTGGSPRVEVLNFGVPGYSTFQEVAAFNAIGRDFDPDLVLMYFIRNDFGLPFFIKSFGDSDEIVPGTTFDKMSEEGEHELVGEKRSTMFKLLNPNHQIRDIANALNEQNIPFYLVFNPHGSSDLTRRKLWVLKPRKFINVVDLRDEFRRITKEYGIDQNTLKLPHDEHPNARKHALLADMLTASLLGEFARLDFTIK